MRHLLMRTGAVSNEGGIFHSRDCHSASATDVRQTARVRQTASAVCPCQATDRARVRRQKVPVSRLGALTVTHAWLLMLEGAAEQQARRVEKQNMDSTRQRNRKVQRTVPEVVKTDEVSATLLWCGGAGSRKKTAQGGQAVQGPD